MDALFHALGVRMDGVFFGMGYLSDFLLGFGLGMVLSTDRMCQVWIAGCFCNEVLTNVDTTFFLCSNSCAYWMMVQLGRLHPGCYSIDFHSYTSLRGQLLNVYGYHFIS